MKVRKIKSFLKRLPEYEFLLVYNAVNDHAKQLCESCVHRQCSSDPCSCNNCFFERFRV